jgi:large subunit ribosomal protein L22
MEVLARAKWIGVSPRKARLVLEPIRGKRVEEALTILQFMPTPAARVVEKVVKSAAANAENNYALSADDLRVKYAFADDGRRLKRFRPAARGRVHPYVRRTAHVTVVVEEV